MADHTKIEWTDATWNPITGCTLVSEGCRHCYAARLAATRLRDHPSRKGLARINAAGEAKFTGEVRLNYHWMHQPLQWKRPRMIFVCAHGDLFHESVPRDWVDMVFAVMAMAPQHIFQVLTKRPERARAYLTERALLGLDIAACKVQLYGPLKRDKPLRVPFAETGVGSEYRPWPLPNVWLGTSVEDQATANARIPYLVTTPAAVRWISAEPLLGPVDLNHVDFMADCPSDCEYGAVDPSTGCFECRRCEDTGKTDEIGLDWVVAGGESGNQARPANPQWFRDLRDQCAKFDIPFLFKQWGEWVSVSEVEGPGEHHAFPDGRTVRRTGKSSAGRSLDGVEHNGFPEVRHG